MRLIAKNFSHAVGLFGLRTTQMRAHEYYHNAGWYNVQGQKIGWGDLNKEDIELLKEELQEDELFILLSERDSYWEFVEETHPLLLGDLNKTSSTIYNPGVEYVRDHAMAFIRKGDHKWIDRFGGKTPHEGAILSSVWTEMFDEYLRKVLPQVEVVV